MSDLDVASIIKELNKKEYDDKQFQTVLLEDETCENYVIKDIFIDEDNDVVFKIERL